MGNNVGGLQPPPRSMQIAPIKPLHRRGLAFGLILSGFGVHGGYHHSALIGCRHLNQEPAIFYRHADCATRFTESHRGECRLKPAITLDDVG